MFYKAEFKQGDKNRTSISQLHINKECFSGHHVQIVHEGLTDEKVLS